MATSTVDLKRVQALHNKYLDLKSKRDLLIRQRDDLMVQKSMAEEQLVGIYGPDWETGYQADLDFVISYEANLSSALSSQD